MRILIVFFFILFSISCINSEKIEVKSTKPSKYYANCDTSDFYLYNYFKESKINRFEWEINRFKKEDAENGIIDSAIVFVGSSSIRKWHSLNEDFAPLTVLNRGFGGSTFPEMIFYVNDLVLKYNPSKIVVYEGDNDQYFMNPKQIFECACYFEKLIHSKLPNSEIYFMSIKPSASRRDKMRTMMITNTYLKNYSDTTNLTHYINVWDSCFVNNRIRSDIFAPDSLHLNSKGYQMLTKIVKPEIEK